MAISTEAKCGLAATATSALSYVALKNIFKDVIYNGSDKTLKEAAKLYRDLCAVEGEAFANTVTSMINDSGDDYSYANVQRGKQYLLSKHPGILVKKLNPPVVFISLILISASVYLLNKCLHFWGQKS